MQFLTAEQLRPGVRLRSRLYGPDGRLLIGDGVVLTESMLPLVMRLRPNGVYVDVPPGGDRTTQPAYAASATATVGANATSDADPSSEQADGLGRDFRAAAAGIVRNAYREAKRTGTFAFRPVSELANRIVDAALAKPNFRLRYKDVRLPETEPYDHAVNVCFVSVLLAIRLNFNMLQLKQLALGALLHDIGYASTDERATETHVWNGFHILRKHSEFPLFGAHVALQHHERFDGSGYPKRSDGQNIHLFARICAIADDFDHLVNDRASPHHPADAIRILQQKAGRDHDPQLVDAFVRLAEPASPAAEAH